MTIQGPNGVPPEAVAVLARAARDGDRRALGQLYELYADPVWHSLYRRTGQRSVADDLAGEVWERVLTRIGTFDPARGQFVSWLYTIASSAVADHRRREGPARRLREVRSHLLHVGPSEVDPERGPEDQVMATAEAEVLRAELDALPARQAQALRLTEVEGFSTHDAAQVLGITEAGVRLLRMRGLKKLRERVEALARNEFDLPRVYQSVTVRTGRAANQI